MTHLSDLSKERKHRKQYTIGDFHICPNDIAMSLTTL